LTATKATTLASVAKKKKTGAATEASVRTELHCGGGHTLYSGFASESAVGVEGGEVRRRALGAVR
jgi:hypothetical protein